MSLQALSFNEAIDLHSSNSVSAVRDETDRPLRKCRLPDERPTSLKALKPFRDELTGVAVESTYNWYWLVDGMVDYGDPMHLVTCRPITRRESRSPAR